MNFEESALRKYVRDLLLESKYDQYSMRLIELLPPDCAIVITGDARSGFALDIKYTDARGKWKYHPEWRGAWWDVSPGGERCGYAFEVLDVSINTAKKRLDRTPSMAGLGPLFYDVCLQICSKIGGGIMSARHSVKPAAFHVWDMYKNKRSNVDAILIDDDACSGKGAKKRGWGYYSKAHPKSGVTKKELTKTTHPLAYRYMSKDYDLLDKLAAMGKLHAPWVDAKYSVKSIPLDPSLAPPKKKRKSRKKRRR